MSSRLSWNSLGPLSSTCPISRRKLSATAPISISKFLGWQAFLKILYRQGRLSLSRRLHASAATSRRLMIRQPCRNTTAKLHLLQHDLHHTAMSSIQGCIFWDCPLLELSLHHCWQRNTPLMFKYSIVYHLSMGFGCNATARIVIGP